jgi:hypothetical protein
MALPVLQKTWIFSENNTIGTGGPFVGYGALMFAWKTFLTTGLSPWVVVLSSDAATAGASDLWINAAACNTHHDPGNPHSWIVLQNDAISPGFQMCVNLERNGGGALTIMDVFFSEAAGFTGGTINDRPTATDEVSAHSSTGLGRHNWTDAVDLTVNPAQLHMQRSDDGTITRWWIFVNGYCPCFYTIEEPKDAVPSWSIPWCAVACVDWYAATNYRPTYAYLNDIKTNTTSRADGVGQVNLYLTSEGAISSMLGQLQTSGNDLDGGAFPFFPIGLFSDAAGSRGRLGALTDIWWGSTFPGSGDHYPGDASRQFVQVDDLILPWSGGGQMLTT